MVYWSKFKTTWNPGDYVRGFGFLSFAKNIVKNIGKNISKILSGKNSHKYRFFIIDNLIADQVQKV